MSWISELHFRLNSLRQKPKAEAEMADEIREHLELRVDRNIAAGMSPDEARHAAQRSFGGVEQVKERCRDARGTGWIEVLFNDLRFARRTLAKSPGFSLAVIATFAVGIGSVTAVVSVARHVLFPTIPFKEHERVFVLNDTLAPRGTRYVIREPMFRSYLAAKPDTFEGLAAQRIEPMNLVVNQAPLAVHAALVSEDFFTVFDAIPVQGRVLLPRDYDGEADTVILSHNLWTAQFGSDASLLGREVLIGGKLRRVVGALPRSFRTPLGYQQPDVYLPMPREAQTAGRLLASNVDVAARLAPSVTPEQAAARLAAARTTATGLSPLDKRIASVIETQLNPIQALYRTPIGRAFWLYLGAVGLLYASACINAGNLMLSRTVARRRELGVRLALGGSRSQIMRLLMVENLCLGMLGGAAGLLIAHWGCVTTTRLLSDKIGLTGEIPSLSPTMLLITMLLGLVTSAAVGLLPMANLNRSDVTEALKEGAGSIATSRRLTRVRGSLVVIQAALAVILLAGAGLMAKTLLRMQQVGVGFNPENVYAVVGEFQSVQSAEAFVATAKQTKERLEALPGVQASASSNVVPFTGYAFTPVGPEKAMVHLQMVSPEYFTTLGLPLLAGRGFAGGQPGDPPTVVINEALSRELFPNESPLGKKLDMALLGTAEITGVVKGTFDGPRVHERPQCYVPYWHGSNRSDIMTILLRFAGQPPPNFESLVRHAVYEIDPRIVTRLVSLETSADDVLRVERTTLRVFELFSVLGLALSVVGLFSVVAYGVVQRRGEFGIRAVLGATPTILFRMVLTRGLALAGIGIVIGLGVALALTRLIEHLLFQTSPQDPWILAGAAMTLLLASGLACWAPARRAAKIDLIIALRAE